MHRLRLPRAAAQKMAEENKATCDALIGHLDGCLECRSSDNFCPAAKPLHDAYRTTKMRSRLYFGQDVTSDEDSDSDTFLP